MTLTCLKSLGLASLLALLSGCGQSGPLYLPGDPSTVQATPSIGSVLEGEEDDENVGEDEEPEEDQ
ncbi:MAG: lipoprotein [Pseudomonadota bacterium]